MAMGPCVPAREMGVVDILIICYVSHFNNISFQRISPLKFGTDRRTDGDDRRTSNNGACLFLSFPGAARLGELKTSR